MYLLLKDLRQTLWPAILAVVILLAPPLIFLIDCGFNHKSIDRNQPLTTLMVFALIGSIASLIASSSIAGVSFARERRERTVELLATLPIPRWKIVMSKAVAALVVALAPFAAGIAVVVALSTQQSGFWQGPADVTMLRVWVMVGTMWLTLFGLGWLLSSLLRSEVLASAVPLLVLVILSVSIVLWGRPDPGTMSVQHQDAVVISRLTWTFGVLGTIGVVGGTLTALMRRSP